MDKNDQPSDQPPPGAWGPPQGYPPPGYPPPYSAPGHPPPGYPPPPPGAVPHTVWLIPGLASAGSRLAARIIDYAVLFAVGGLVTAGYARTFFPQNDSDAAANPVAVAVLVAFIPFWLWGLEAIQLARWGRTIGMLLLKIRVVPADRQNEPLGTGRALLRAFCYPPLFTVLGYLTLGVVSLLNVLWLLWDKPRRQCLHDKVAGTVVMHDAQTPRGPMLHAMGGALAVLCVLGIAGILAGG